MPQLTGNSSQSSTPGTNNGGSNLNSFTKPANLRSGLAWSLGVFISKPLGKNARLLAGLNYHYYSMGLQVGAKIDSNKALLEYNNGNSTGYTNRFHFIELPVNIEKQLGKDSRFSVNAGLAFSVLAGSNALQYSASKNTYFRDNSYINKAQLETAGGFQLPPVPKISRDRSRAAAELWPQQYFQKRAIRQCAPVYGWHQRPYFLS